MDPRVNLYVDQLSKALPKAKTPEIKAKFQRHLDNLRLVQKMRAAQEQQKQSQERGISG